NVLSESNAAFGDRYKYTGRELDTETSLQYNRARYYDPRIGRWTSEDPKGFGAGDRNLYRYVGNGPTDAVDPSGLDAGIPPEAYAKWWKQHVNVVSNSKADFTDTQFFLLSGKTYYNVSS